MRAVLARAKCATARGEKTATPGAPRPPPSATRVRGKRRRWVAQMGYIITGQGGTTALGRFTSPDTVIPDQHDPRSYDRFSYVLNNPIRFIDPSGHSPEDECYDSGSDCEYNRSIPIENLWDPDYEDLIDNPNKAVEAYLHFLQDPAYFANLYANPESWANSEEVLYLDIFLQYSKFHTTAAAVISVGFDPDVAAYLDQAHVYYGLGDTETASQLLAAAILVGTPSGVLVSVPDSWLGRVADTGKGIVYQRPGASYNANSIRIMDPGADPRYPLGYVRYYNNFGQPLNPLTGNPASDYATHIPMNYRGPVNRWPK